MDPKHAVESRNRAAAGPPVLRRARPEDAAALSDVAFRSKAFWGYPPEFMEACREDLTVRPEDVARDPYFLVEEAGRVLGFYNLKETARGAELQNLFVAPEAIGRGLGRQLWAHLRQEALARGLSAVLIDSDPHAEAFYLRMGARRIGSAPSSVFPGRELPLLRYDLR